MGIEPSSEPQKATYPTRALEAGVLAEPGDVGFPLCRVAFYKGNGAAAQEPILEHDMGEMVAVLAFEQTVGSRHKLISPEYETLNEEELVLKLGKVAAGKVIYLLVIGVGSVPQVLPTE